MANDIADEISQRNTTTYPYPPLYVSSFPSAPTFFSCCPFSLPCCVENKEDNRLLHPIRWRCCVGCLPCLLRSPIATYTPTMTYPLPHPGLEHEGDERIKKVSFAVAFCVETSTKQSKLHSPRRTYLRVTAVSSKLPIFLSRPVDTAIHLLLDHATYFSLKHQCLPQPPIANPPGNAVSTGSAYTKSGKAQSRMKRLV